MMSRRTDWTEEKESYSFGSGQRVFATNVTDYPLLEVRTIELTHPPA
jgi:protein involved in temperature-dependent protein secretion